MPKPNLPSPPFTMKHLIFFLLLLLLRHRSSSATAPTTVEDTCKSASSLDSTVDYAFCQTTLQADPDSRNATLGGLGLVSLRLLGRNLTDTLALINRLIKTNDDGAASKRLGTCRDLYSQAGDYYLEQAVQNYQVNKYGVAKLEISAVATAAVTCEDGFREAEVRSPLTRNNDFAREISEIALAIITLLQRSNALD